MGFSIESDRNVQVSSLDEMVLTDGLVLYYTMDSIDGTTLLDNSGNNYSGTIYGATPATGINGNALSFDGSTNKVYTPSNSSFNFTGNVFYTVSAWIKPVSGGVLWYGIISKGNSQQYALTLNSSTLHLHYETSQSSISPLNTATNIISWDTWAHTVITYDGSFKRIYVNGIEAISQSGVVTSASNIEELRIGEGNTNENFNGLIDEVRIYNRALSAAEVKQLYKLNAPTNVASVKENQ